jgi:hypothetical protein
MKTLANPEDRQEIVKRLSAIGPASKRRWGKMTVAEMICHLSDAFRVILEGREAKPVHNWFSRSLFKWAALWFPTHWPHGVNTVPECDPQARGTQPAEIEADLKRLQELLDRFMSAPSASGWPEHPIFGQLSAKEWMRWGYLHLDHHLRQFDA